MKQNREMILNDLAPCGIDCSRCVVYKGGVIQKSSTELKKALTNFERKAEDFARMVPELEHYKEFTRILDFFTNPTCNGCRNGDSRNPACKINTCFKEKGVDFCYECDDYPCDKNSFNNEFKKKWIRINNSMKEMGLENYFRESKNKPRY